MHAHRFNDVFTRDEQGLPRNWSPSANIPTIAQQARQSAARLLALLAVIRLHTVKVPSNLICIISLVSSVAAHATILRSKVLFLALQASAHPCN